MGDPVKDLAASINAVKRRSREDQTCWRYTLALDDASALLEERDELKRQLAASRPPPFIPCERKVGVTVTLNCQGSKDHEGQCWDEVNGEPYYWN